MRSVTSGEHSNVNDLSIVTTSLLYQLSPTQNSLLIYSIAFVFKLQKKDSEQKSVDQAAPICRSHICKT